MIDSNLANKYRPQKFSDVIGQPLAVNTLKCLASASSLPARSIFLKGSWGSGKCISGEQRVSTSKGYVRIKDLLPDAEDGFTDFVIDVEQPNGQYIPTSHFYKESNADLFTLRLKSGAVITGTAKHPVNSVKSGVDNQVQLNPIGDLAVGDSVVKSCYTTLHVFIGTDFSRYTRFYKAFGDLSGTESFKSHSSAFFALWGILAAHSVVYNENGHDFIVIQYDNVRLLQDLLEYLRIPYEIHGTNVFLSPSVSSDLVREINDIVSLKRTNFKNYFSYRNFQLSCDTTPSLLEDEIVEITHEVTTVYDLSVPDTHLFMSCSVVNHNTTLARIFAKAINCKEFSKTGEVCGVCDNCREVMSKNSRLFIEYDSAAVGNVETIRNFPTLFSYDPGGTRVVVLDECHAISNQALTALLKIIEEGIPNTVFVFCSTEDILGTIKSRSIVLNIHTIPFQLVTDRLRDVANKEGIDITDGDIASIAMRSAGHMRDALSMLQLYTVVGSDGLENSYSKLAGVIYLAYKKREDEAVVCLDGVLKFPAGDILTELAIIDRNICAAKTDSTAQKPYREMALAGVDSYISERIYGYYVNACRDEIGIEIVLRGLIQDMRKVPVVNM